MRRLSRITLLLPLVIAAACKAESARNDETAVVADAPISAPAPSSDANTGLRREEAPPEIAQGVAQQSAPAGQAPAPGTQPPASAAATDSSASRMIIRTGTATLQVDKIDPAIARVQQLAQQMGGYVANTSVQGGSQNAREATLELKLPAQRWDQALAGLRPLGKLESLTTSTEDVGEEYVDVTARMNNARRLEQRLVELLATRTGKLEDVLAVERELARVREEIERFEGRLRFLRSRVSLSTLTVRLHEPVPVLGGRPGSNPIVDAFRDAWDNFVGFLAGLIASLGWLIPLAAIVAVLVWAYRRFVPRRPRHPGAPTPDAGPGGAGGPASGPPPQA
jgi:hypothetical protein